jgi:hypothetical protein
MLKLIFITNVQVELNIKFVFANWMFCILSVNPRYFPNCIVGLCITHFSS